MVVTRHHLYDLDAYFDNHLTILLFDPTINDSSLRL